MLVLAGTALLAVGAVTGQLHRWAWSATMYSLRAQFPSVQTVTAEDLRTYLNASGNGLLIDARTDSEFGVSRIRGAAHAADLAAALALLRHAGSDTRVVVYCSLGYRSDRLVEQLQDAGYRRARSLEGGIFAWANSGRPVYRGEQRVAVVHPFREPWALLLAPELRYSPASGG
jgi:rhodanese-related sulfurtransferase